MNLDNFDIAILTVLQEDARASLQKVSNRVGLSTTPAGTGSGKWKRKA
jgi:Lrp/AsnC family leucine-responsive transcriptional regulator